MIGLTPGLVAREITLNLQGDPHDLLVDIPRLVPYRVADPTATPPVISGLEYALGLLDYEFGNKKDRLEEKAVTELEKLWREQGTSMAVFRSKVHKAYTKMTEKGGGSMSDSLLSKRLL